MSPQPPILTIGIVSGEASGDALGADFMAQMNNVCDGIRWVGVGGANMQAQGLQSIFELERLAVMGLVEVLKHLPDLFKARAELLEVFNAENIDWFVGIDAPDFNLRVAKKLKPHGVFCVQYVSPSVWAWRENRIHGIKQSTDLVLCLFPFELEVYQKHNHPAICVGHPLLKNLPTRLRDEPVLELRRELVWQNEPLQVFFTNHDTNISQLICVMPGSRKSEINAMMPVLMDAIAELLKVDNLLCFVLPVVDKAHVKWVQKWLNKASPQVRQTVAVVYDDGTYQNQARQFDRAHKSGNNNLNKQGSFSQAVMAISDLVILASGTATLEAMLLSKPMVVVYQLNKLTYAIASRLLKVPYVSLPNILAHQKIVPELIQEAATADNISHMVIQLLKPANYAEQKRQLIKHTILLRQQSNVAASNAVLSAWYFKVPS